MYAKKTKPRLFIAVLLLACAINTLVVSSASAFMPYVGEIRMFAGNFAPAGWMTCEGQLLLISEYETLFQLIGTTFGGDGVNTFALPDLRGRAPIHMNTSPLGTTYIIGQQGGSESESVTLTTNQIPSHTQQIGFGTDPGTTNVPTNAYYAKALLNNREINVYGTGDMITRNFPASGGNQPHENMQPYLVINYIISLYGIFPTET